MCEFLDAMDGVDWSEVPVYQALRGTRPNDASPGCTVSDGDFVWSDTYTHAFFDAPTEHVISRVHRTYKDCLPTGFLIVSDDGIARQVSIIGEPIPVVPILDDVRPVL